MSACSGRYIVAGEYDDSVSTSSERQTKQIAQIIRHTGFTPDFNNDITLLELKNDLEYNEYVQPICLPQDTSDLYVDVNAFVSGWGTLHFSTLI